MGNTGKVPLKIVWNFIIDDEYPARIDKYNIDKKGCKKVSLSYAIKCGKIVSKYVIVTN